MARPKGSKNKTGAEVKAQILACYERLGGLESFTNWARDNPSEFYAKYASLAPREIDAVVTYHDETDLSDAELASIATGRGDGAAETPDSTPVESSVH